MREARCQVMPGTNAEIFLTIRRLNELLADFPHNRILVREKAERLARLLQQEPRRPRPMEGKDDPEEQT